jgi:hypothetical protein
MRKEIERFGRVDFERMDFDEDRTVLGILSNKVFRRAVVEDGELLLPPDIEKEALEAVPELTEAMELLDAAREGMTEIDTAIAEWKAELSVGKTP